MAKCRECEYAVVYCTSDNRRYGCSHPDVMLHTFGYAMTIQEHRDRPEWCPRKKEGGTSAREIKFRAYIKPLKWLVPVERICFDAETVEVDLTEGQGDTAEYDFNEVELMQYTGLKDKNGVEIYEGDVVNAWGGESCFGVYEFNEYKRVVGDLIGDTFELGFYEHIEVIGNIHDNPELLEEGC